MPATIITPNGTAVTRITPAPAAAGPTSSTNIGELNAPFWKPGGYTSGTGAWGTPTASAVADTVTIGYPTASGTAGFVSLQCTGDTDSFQLVKVEGETLDSPQTFATLTNDHDFMYIAFKGTVAGPDATVEIEILPIYNGGAAKTMTIDAIDHEGNSVGTITASATILEALLSVTSLGDFTGLSVAPNQPPSFSVLAPHTDPGFFKATASSGWTGGNACVGRINKEIISGASCYVEYTPTALNNHMNMFLCYKSDYDSYIVPLLSNTSLNPLGAGRWSSYVAGTGGLITPQGFPAPGFVPPMAGFTPAGPAEQVGRSVRLSVTSNIVKLQYSDDAWATPVDVYTFADPVDIPGNGPLVAYFGNWGVNSGCFENIKLFGILL